MADLNQWKIPHGRVHRTWLESRGLLNIYLEKDSSGDCLTVTGKTLVRKT